MESIKKEELKWHSQANKTYNTIDQRNTRKKNSK